MFGSVVSATVLTVLPEALRAFADYRMVAYAIVLILVMIFRPEGLFGTYQKDEGQIFLDGREVSFSGPKDALENGVAMVHQVVERQLH